MKVFWWANRRRELVPGSVVEAFAVNDLTASDGEATARGDIALIDETATDEAKRNVKVAWCASTTVSGGALSPDWLVRKDGKHSRFCTGFVHDALCLFIREELAANLRNCLAAKESSVPVTEGVSVPVNAGTHPSPVCRDGVPVKCVCNELEGSQYHRPFSFTWRNGDAGDYIRIAGNYRCITCSCGERWWLSRPDRDRWVRVLDGVTWGALVRWHGFPLAPVAHLPGGVCLVSLIESKKAAREHYVPHTTF